MFKESEHQNEDYLPKELNKISITNDDIEKEISANENVITENEIQLVNSKAANHIVDDDVNQGEMKMTYTVNEAPPWYLALPLSVQQYLTMFSSTVTTPFIIGPAICLPEDNPARAYLLSTILFVSGIVTLLQSFLGVRLPVIQGSSAAFYTPMFALMALPKWTCPQFNDTTSGDYDDDIWQSRMRELQGCIAVASLLPLILSLTGAIHILIRYITPLVVTPTITLVGLSLFDTGSDLASGNWGIAIGTIACMLLFCLYLENVKIPFPQYKVNKGCSIGWYGWFKLFPIISTVVVMWLLCYILTITDALHKGNEARTDSKSSLLSKTAWFRFPYPFQWGIPTVSAAGVCGMLAAMVATIIESVGDYYACARLSAAPTPPPHAITRGILIEGVGCALAGIWGSGCGTVSYAENIGAISITKIASRRVTQLATLFMFFFGLFTKFGALFVCIPDPVIGGMFMIMFGLIAAVGISNVRHVDLNSTRNLCILGFSLFFGLSLPRWVSSNEDSINTGNETLDEVIIILLESSMLIGGVVGFILDNTVPGTPKERGLLHWYAASKSDSLEAEVSKVYDLPIGMSFIKKHKIFKYLPFCPTFEGAKWRCKLRKSSTSIEITRSSDKCTNYESYTPGNGRI